MNDADDLYAVASAVHAGAIERIAFGYERDRELRLDLIQEIHLALWRSFRVFDHGCSQKSWVYRIAHNVAVSHVIRSQRQRRETFVELDELHAIPDARDLETDTGERLTLDRLLALIHRLKPADRQVMLLYLEDLTATEIGEVTGLSPGAVAVRIHRIKAILAVDAGEEKSKDDE